MGLTSDLFVALLSLIALITMVATTLLWPRVAGRGPSHLAARAGLISATQLTAIVAVLAGLNSYFSFVISWSDLIGGGASRPAAHIPAATRAGAPITVTRRQLASTTRAGDPARSGEILTVRIRGTRTGIVVPRSYMYLPPQYFQPAYARDLFPAVLVLSGYPSDPRSEISRLGLPGAAAAGTAAGRLRPAIFLMMFSSVAMPRDTECTDIPGGPQTEAFFAQDVPLAMERQFRVASAAGAWAVMGDSTGGYCAVKLAMMHSDRFCAAVSLSGYYSAVSDFTTGSLFGRSAAYRSENDLFWRLRHEPPPPVSVLLTSSRVGESDYLPTMRFLRLIHPPMRGYALILPEGGHNFRTWKRELVQALEWLSGRLAAPSAASAP
ncbi:MAG: alpha/beta hydrolase [Micromonosporaceae bacterium]